MGCFAKGRVRAVSLHRQSMRLERLFSQNGPAFHLRSRQIDPHRHFIPSTTFEHASSSLLPDPATLLEEKWDLHPQALISNIRHPRRVQRTCPWPGREMEISEAVREIIDV